MIQKTNPLKKIFPLLMWTTAAIFYFYEFFLQVSPSVMTKDLMSVFAIDAAGLGMLTSLYFYSYAVMQIPAGIMLDRFGAKRLLTVAALTCAAGSITFASTHIFAIACVGRLMIGFGSSFAAISCLYIASTWLPLRWFSFLTGLLITIGMTGAICGQTPLTLLVAKLGWQESMIFLGILGIAIAIILGIIVRDRKPISAKEFEQRETNLFQSLKQLIKKPQNWICASYASLMYTPTLALGALWGIDFVACKYQIPHSSAAGITSMMFLGFIIGAPLFGWLSDRFKRRKPFLYINTIGSLISISIAIYFPASYSIHFAAMSFLSFGFFSSGFIIAFSVIRETNSPSITGGAMGFMNAMNMAGGAIVPPIIGVILDIYSLHHSLSLQHFSLTGYKISLAILPAIIFTSLILLFFIKETYARPFTQTK